MLLFYYKVLGIVKQTIVKNIKSPLNALKREDQLYVFA